MKSFQYFNCKALIGFFSLFVVAVAAQAADVQAVDNEFKEGTHYRLLKPVQPTADPQKIEVVELFWYGCPHCFSLEPYAESWHDKATDSIDFIRIPAVFGKVWELHARAYYTAQYLGILEQTHTAFFEAFHQKNQHLDSNDKVADFYVGFGAERQAVLDTMSSFAVNLKIKQAKSRAIKYSVRGVPAVVVNGKYLTDISMAGGSEKVFQVVDYLIGKESQ